MTMLDRLGFNKLFQSKLKIWNIVIVCKYSVHYVLLKMEPAN